MTSRFHLSMATALLVSAMSLTALAETPDTETIERFEFLSQNGNSSCSRSFRDSIADIPAEARLQGSCCSEMDLHRYSEQVAGLKQYSHIADIPPDPYDVAAPLARKLIAAYEQPLTPEQQEHYDLAMATSNEKGPCCCPCWRWDVFGGLGKLLIREHGFNGEQVAQVWNLSDGCGGDSQMHT